MATTMPTVCLATANLPSSEPSTTPSPNRAKNFFAACSSGGRGGGDPAGRPHDPGETGARSLSPFSGFGDSVRGPYAASHGLITVTPAAWKGLVSRVATINPLATATAAMQASAVSIPLPELRTVASNSA